MLEANLARPRRANTLILVSAAIAALASSCATLSPQDGRIVRTSDGRTVSVAEAADELAQADVVFLGEEHDNDAAHALQLALTEALLERRGEVAISMEMFERDGQSRLDLYLAGAVDEAFFLAGSRPWGNYAEHYRPAIELAKAEGLDVIAANVYRPIAASVAKQGVAAAKGDPWAAIDVDAAPAGEYYERFVRVMGQDPSHAGPRLQQIYAAQAVKDDTMAESIARYLDERGADAPQVVHWCGKFHSDYGLGTVERLLARKPGLSVAVVSTLSGAEARALDDEERELGAFVFMVPAMPKPAPKPAAKAAAAQPAVKP
ncbi:MAG: ChaN family lipoprotein [Planctomycetota bacterium]